jgi:nucleotide-binding universal stress UspA family protein
MKILVATDGSKSALNAVKHAVKLFKELSPSGRHSITLVTVHDDGGSNRSKAGDGTADGDGSLRQLREKELRPAIRLLERAGIKHRVDIRSGPSAAQEILACAREGKFDLIVLGAKGRSAIADLLLGSVANRVLATAQIPVLLVK